MTTSTVLSCALILLSGGLETFIPKTMALLETEIQAVFDDFRKVAVSGDKDLGIPILDPLALPNIEIDGVGIRNVTVEGISKMVAPKIAITILPIGLKLLMEVPSIIVKGKYKASPYGVNDDSPFSITTSNIKIDGKAKRLGNDDFFKNIDFNIRVGNINANFTGLFANEMEQLSLNINEDVFNKLKLELSDSLTKLLNNGLLGPMEK